MLLQLNPPLPLETPKGKGYAHIVIDYGPEMDLIWIVFIDASRECWAYSNREIRLQPNITLGRPNKLLPAESATPIQLV